MRKERVKSIVKAQGHEHTQGEDASDWKLQVQGILKGTY